MGGGEERRDKTFGKKSPSKKDLDVFPQGRVKAEGNKQSQDKTGNIPRLYERREKSISLTTTEEERPLEPAVRARSRECRRTKGEVRVEKVRVITRTGESRERPERSARKASR